MAAGVQKKSGFEAYAGSGAACTGPGGCVAGETCVDPDGAAGSAGSMCMAGSGTAADPWRTERYLWRLHVYDLGLLAAWDFDRFDLATHAAGLTHESANRAGFQ